MDALSVAAYYGRAPARPSRGMRLLCLDIRARLGRLRRFNRLTRAYAWSGVDLHPMRLGFAVKVLGGGGLPSHDTRAGSRGPTCASRARLRLDSRIDLALGALRGSRTRTHAPGPSGCRSLSAFGHQPSSCSEKCCRTSKRHPRSRPRADDRQKVSRSSCEPPPNRTLVGPGRKGSRADTTHRRANPARARGGISPAPRRAILQGGR